MMATLGHYTPKCPECGSDEIYRTAAVVETERVNFCDADGGIIEADNVNIIEWEQVGQLECANGHKFDTPIATD